MSNHTPGSPWNSRFSAEIWLQGIITECLGGRYWGLSEDDELFDAVFEMHRVRWQVCYRLKKRFVDDPDGLIDFIEKYKAGKTDEEWEAGKPVMGKNKGPELKEVREGD